MNTKTEVSEFLKSQGVTKPFRVERDPEDERVRWRVMTNQPARIEDGWLVGTDIAIAADEGCFRVWTSKHRKARALAAEYGLRGRLKLDGEAELWIPWALGDALLPGFGAKVRKTLSPEALKAARERGLNLQNFRAKANLAGTFGQMTPANRTETP